MIKIFFTIILVSNLSVQIIIMSIPDYQALMLPVLKLTNHHSSLSMRYLTQLLSDEFELSNTERRKLLPSGKQTIIHNRVSWARTYLKKAGLLSSPERGVIAITDRGKAVLFENLSRIDVQYLDRFSEFVGFRKCNQPDTEILPSISMSNRTPEEELEGAYSQLKNEVLDDLIKKVKSCSPEFFETLVVNTVVKMGYGGSLQDAGKAVGKSGDEGIDGIINEDRLGLDVIYLQAKKWEGNIGRPEIQKFADALQGKRAKKGIFITTSDFTSEAKEYTKNLEARIILISGQQLAELMWEHDIGLSTVATYEIKKLDIEYFGD